MQRKSSTYIERRVAHKYHVWRRLRTTREIWQKRRIASHVANENTITINKFILTTLKLLSEDFNLSCINIILFQKPSYKNIYKKPRCFGKFWLNYELWYKNKNLSINIVTGSTKKYNDHSIKNKEKGNFCGNLERVENQGDIWCTWVVYTIIYYFFFSFCLSFAFPLGFLLPL